MVSFTRAYWESINKASQSSKPGYAGRIKDDRLARPRGDDEGYGSRLRIEGVRYADLQASSPDGSGGRLYRLMTNPGNGQGYEHSSHSGGAGLISAAPISSEDV
jgi:hypothetical protein